MSASWAGVLHTPNDSLWTSLLLLCREFMSKSKLIIQRDPLRWWIEGKDLQEEKPEKRWRWWSESGWGLSWKRGGGGGCIIGVTASLSLSSWAAEQLQRLPYTLLHLRTALHSRNHFFISSSSHHYLSHHQAFMEGNLAGCPWVFSLSEFQYVGLCVVWCIVFHNIPSLALDPTLYYTDRNQMFILPVSSKKKFSSCREQNFQSFIPFLASHLQDLPRHLSRRMEIWFDLQNVSKDLQNISSLTHHPRFRCQRETEMHNLPGKKFATETQEHNAAFWVFCILCPHSFRHGGRWGLDLICEVGKLVQAMI